MKRRLWTVLVGLASIAALIAIPSALAAFSTPKLEVRQDGMATTFKFSQGSSEDAVASIRILVPPGTALTTTQAPGTRLGTVRAILKAHALAGAEVPAEGNVVVAAPGQIPTDMQTRCLGTATPIATWVLALTIAGMPRPIPLWLVPAAGPLAALGPTVLQVCALSPYVPEASGGAPAGAQLISAEFTAQGVFSPVPAGAFVSILTPWTPGTGTVNTAGTIAAPAAIAPGAVTASAKVAGKGAVVSGLVTQGGQPRGGVRVNIFGSAKRTGLKRLGRVTSAANGRYSLKTKTGTFFRATAIASVTAAPPLCSVLGPALTPLGVPCVNPTVNGFTAKSKVVRKR